MGRVGEDLIEAFEEMAADLCGDVRVEICEIPADVMTPERIRTLRSRLATSTHTFKPKFAIPARTMEAYERGCRRPDQATTAFLRAIEREPDAERCALSS